MAASTHCSWDAPRQGLGGDIRRHLAHPLTAPLPLLRSWGLKRSQGHPPHRQEVGGPEALPSQSPYFPFGSHRGYWGLECLPVDPAPGASTVADFLRADQSSGGQSLELCLCSAG